MAVTETKKRERDTIERVRNTSNAHLVAISRRPVWHRVAAACDGQGDAARFPEPHDGLGAIRLAARRAR